MASSTRSLRSRTAVKAELNVADENAVDEKTVKKKLPRKRKETKASESKPESKIKSESSNDLVTEAKQIKLEAPSNNKKVSVSPKEKKSPIKVEIKPEITDSVNDIENGGWEPNNWKVVWENILKMRKLHVAPVDSLGCEECPEKDTEPEIFRYQTLISVMLSSQTRDQVTHAASQRLIEHGLNIDNILKTSDEKLGQLIYPAGFWKGSQWRLKNYYLLLKSCLGDHGDYRMFAHFLDDFITPMMLLKTQWMEGYVSTLSKSKVKFIKKTSQILKDQYNGDVPRTLKELCKLPGVGPKMAHIVMSVAWNDTVGIAVDTHVHRISNRLGWVRKATKDPEQTRKALESWLPKDLWDPINITLVGFGQTICKPVGPTCESCRNNKLCPYGKLTLAGKNKKNKTV